MLRSNSKSLGNHVHSSRILYIDVGIEAMPVPRVTIQYDTTLLSTKQNRPAFPQCFYRA